MRFVLAVIAALSVTSAYALPNDPNGTPGQQRAMACLEQVVVSFSANKPSLVQGDVDILNWSVQVPSTCYATLKQLLLDGAPVPFSGSKVVQPASSGDYILTLPFSGGEAEAGRTHVTVVLPPVVNIYDGSPRSRGLMVQALNEPNKVVRLVGDFDMDLTGLQDINIAAGVTFQGERDAQHEGPRLFTTTVHKNLFMMLCQGSDPADNVHISGFRLQGPHWDPIDDDTDSVHERGIYIESCLGTDISNMEIMGFSGAGIYNTDEASGSFKYPGRQNALDATTVHIHDNFIHHNQHIGEFGYGVDVQNSAWANIEHNVFDFNRHAVDASGDWGTAYRFDHNLILKGGGKHDRWYREYTHQIDVHGNENCGPFSDGAYNCGMAGLQFWITSNAVQYVYASAVHIRGFPWYRAWIDNNVFTEDAIDDAVVLNEKGLNVEIGTGALANITGSDSFGKYGVCDIDGDGIDDLFLPTGASWWYMSGANKQWVYLNSFTETLDQVGLGDFDGDHRCDVFTVHGGQGVISSGGRTDWQALAGVTGWSFDQLRFGDFNGDGIMDIFRRAPNGQWTIISPGHYAATPVQSSTVAISDLRLGDFNGDHVTDVVASVGGRWVVSWGARSAWQPLNRSVSDSLSGLLIGDIDGNGIDDVVRYAATGATTGVWQVSVDGRAGWQTLSSLTFPVLDPTESPALNVRGYLGHFASPTGKDLLMIDQTRLGQLLNRGTHAFQPFSPNAY